MITGNPTFAGQIEEVKVELTSVVTDIIVDLSAIMLEMNIYEDLFANYITGTISVSDSVDLINYVPLVGEERLIISYKTPGIGDSYGFVENIFYVYKISDRVTIKEGAQVYVIHFMSEEAFGDQHVKVSKAYKGNIGQMAKSIFNDEDALGAREKVGNKFVIEETGNAFQFVVPTWSPMKALNWLATRSVSRKDNAANYVFYQDSFKYNFVSINSLIAKEPTLKLWDTTLNVRQLQKLNLSENISQYNIVRSVSNDLVLDVASRMASGMYASTMIACDILSKTVNIQEFDYIKTFKDTNHLNKYPVASPKVMRNPRSTIVVYTNHSSMFDEFSSDFPENWLLQRRSLMQQINSYQSEIVVAGRSDYYVGMVIELNMNTIRNHTSNPEDAEEKMHKGKYLVTAIANRFSKNEMESVMCIVKDSIISNLGG